MAALFPDHKSHPNIGNAMALTGLMAAEPILKLALLTKLLESVPSEKTNLGQAKVVLRVIAAVGDGAANVPGLKTAAAIMLEIVNVVETAMHNKDNCNSLALRIYETFRAVQINDLGSTHEFQSIISDFEGSLEKLLDKVKSLASQSFIKRTLHSEANKELLADCEKLLAHCKDLFVIKMHIHTGEKLQKLGDKLDNLKTSGNSPDVNLSISSIPPPAPAIFVGRDEIIEEGIQYLQQKGSRIAIIGAGGMGKTALALTLLHDPKIQEVYTGGYLESSSSV
ncbi:hypothetical protein NLJ89_g11126 [Agrocybe chaxingu]|uniref:Uncharacterized protein n=1 Tax=Agrocybe chaxingu TaxID=84603 RepID=A0A9W8MQ95_9AGAR|nr:hypothetical protein NLJ89_g11126 [Agrocybe chaxingu]